MKAIPRHILSMEAFLYPAAGANDYGEPTWGDEIELKNIYIEPTRSVFANTLGEQLNYQLVLYFDCMNSLPVGTVFSELDKIVLKKKEPEADEEFAESEEPEEPDEDEEPEEPDPEIPVEYLVRSVRELYNPLTGKPHHWEVRLGGN